MASSWHRLWLPVFSLATFGESYFQVLGPKRSTDSSLIKSMGYIWIHTELDDLHDPSIFVAGLW